MILIISSILKSDEKIDFELQIRPSLQYVEVDRTSDFMEGYITKPFTLGGSLALWTKKSDFRFIYERSGWDRSFIGRMKGGEPGPETPIEEIHEFVTSNSYSLKASYKWTTKSFTPYMGMGFKLHCLTAEKIGQTTGLHYISHGYWYPGLSIIAGLKYHITSKVNLFADVDYCILGSSSIIHAVDGYMPVYNILKTNSICVGMGYKFKVPKKYIPIIEKF